MIKPQAPASAVAEAMGRFSLRLTGLSNITFLAQYHSVLDLA